MPNAAGQIQNLISNAHLAREVGDFKTGAATVAAHLFIAKGADDDTVVLAGDADVGAFGIVEQTVVEGKKGNALAAAPVAGVDQFVTGELVRVGSGATRKGVLAAGMTAVKGKPFVTAANGQVRVYLPASNPTPDDPGAIKGVFSESLTTTGSAAFIALEVF